MADLFLFSTALVAIYLTPGPDMLLILSTSLNNGARQAVAVSIGLSLARTLHVLLAALGLAALLQNTPVLYHVVRLAGAAYLLYLAWRFLTLDATASQRSETLSGTPSNQYLRSFSQGVLTNLLNPKSLIFCSVLLPQFINPEQDVAFQFTLLGLILVCIGLGFDLVYSVMGGRFSAFTASRRGMQKAQNRIVAGLLAAIGLKVALA
ncbi:LysE family translocator [Marinobacter sp.]|uniref:LysE family translocator n=1 Tax=Marinobacter sp. TaxID=50741 RepID=UPI00356438B7